MSYFGQDFDKTTKMWKKLALAAHFTMKVHASSKY